MANSTFTFFSSSDASGPGLLQGSAGDLLRVLDACLVTGYSGRTAVSWTKPFVNATNSGCYKPASGAQMTYVINDNGPNVTSTTKEAWITGWESCTAVTAPVGTGYGQFPTPAQLLTTGHYVIRKSATADTVGRQWMIVADGSTCYIFILTGDTAGSYLGAGMGDVFSLKGSTDTFRGMVYGRSTENSAINITASDWDLLGIGHLILANVLQGHLARPSGLTGTSTKMMRAGDATFFGAIVSSCVAAAGVIPCPNVTDNSLYLTPVKVIEYGDLNITPIRGRLRGVYHVCHPIANFTDGQTFSGANDLAGKTFMIVKPGLGNGMWAIETSATVETN